MKRFALIIIMLASLSVIHLHPNQTVSAQGGGTNDLIALTDATPGIDVIVNPATDSTGVVMLELTDATVSITDAMGNLVFEATDPNIAGLEFRFAPNSGAHTITVERMPTATEGYVRIQALAEMVTLPAVQFVSSTSLQSNQEADYPLNATSPSAVVNLSVPAEETQTITASFPGAPVTVQLVNSRQGTAMATLSGGLIDGVRFTVHEGEYQMTMLNNNAQVGTVANVALTPAVDSNFVEMVMAARGETPATNTGITQTSATNQGSACNLTVNVSSANVRSGPGTGYTVLGYAFRGGDFLVGGVNPESGWLLIQSGDGSTGWVSNDVGVLSGACGELAAFDIPFMDAATPAVTVQQAGSYYEDDDDDEYENEHEEHEYEHEDDDDDD